MEDFFEINKTYEQYMIYRGWESLEEYNLYVRKNILSQNLKKIEFFDNQN